MNEQQVRAIHLKHVLQRLLDTLYDDTMDEDQKEAASYAYLTLKQDARTYGDD